MNYISMTSVEILKLAKQYAEDYINAVQKDTRDANRLQNVRKLFKKINEKFTTDIEIQQVNNNDDFKKMLDQYNDLWNVIVASINTHFNKVYLRINAFKGKYEDQMDRNKAEQSLDF